MNVDVAIVGAGPAGSTVAGIVASAGLKVAVFEKEKEIGRSPCAGYVGCIDFPDISRKVIQSKVDSMKTFFPSGKCMSFLINGFNVDRGLFDKELALSAAKCGAVFHLNSDVVDLIGKKDNYSGVRIRGGRKINARVVVGCDGASSVVSRVLGLRNDSVTSIQYDISNCKVDPGVNEIFFDLDYAPGCYVWVFPSGGNSARVGLAVRSHLAGKTALEYLDAFISGHPVASNKFKNCLKTKLSAGPIPVGGLHERICEDNILLVGDSAGMADPVTGAGISYSMLGGRLASQAIIKAIKADDLSLLTEYEQRFRRIMDRHYQKSLTKRKLMDSLTDNRSLEQNLPQVWVTFKEYWM